jgi:hypothetical protein
MADEEEPYITSIPGEMTGFFMYRGSPCVIYEENGERRGGRFVPPDRFYPIDPTIDDYADLYPGCPIHTTPISQWEFEMQVGLDILDYKHAQEDKSQNDEEGASGADQE